MSGKVARRNGARWDLVAIYQHYARDAGMRTADRFLAAAEAAFLRLAGKPSLGNRFDQEDLPPGELRSLPLGSPFRKYLVFYRPVEGGVEIVRILHGARDIPSILADEFGGRDDEVDGGERQGLE